MKSKNIIFLLNGGLGNQFFQYSFAASLSKLTNRKLYFSYQDPIIKKFFYKRENFFEIKNNIKAYKNRVNLLDLIGIKIKRTSFYINSIFFVYRLLIYLNKKTFKLKIPSNFLSFQIIQEKSNNFDKSIIKRCVQSKSTNLFISGYWQSINYFKDQELYIFNSIKIPQSKKKKFQETYNLIKSSNSIALCARLYEDVPTTNKKILIDESTMGGIPNLKYYEQCINLIKKNVSNPTFFIFSAKQYEFFKLLNLGKNTYYLNNDNGFNGTIDNLWLMTECKYQIISYSSYYWFAAWFNKFKNNSTIIYRPNENNKDRVSYYCDDWKAVDW